MHVDVASAHTTHKKHVQPTRSTHYPQESYKNPQKKKGPIPFWWLGMVPMIQKYVKAVICFIYIPIDLFSKNPMNWSQFKKCWVMFQVYLLTFSVYFGAAVYTAGFTDVSQRFHVSNVSATVGL